MRTWILALVAFCLGIIFAPNAAVAQSIEEKNVLKGKVTLDQSTGYIFLHGATRQVGMFLKVPSQEDVAEYTKEWEAELAKAKEKYVKKLARWESAKKTALKTKAKVPEKPEEPTAENFSIGPIDTRNSISFGPEYVFSKDKVAEKYSYMMGVKPGTYIYYGPIFFNVNVGYTGTCYCMGSIQFEVKAGTITDLGNFLTEGPNANDDVKVPTKAVVVPNTFWGATSIEARQGTGKASFGLPETLKAWPSVQAEFRAAGKQDNHFGIMVSRLPPVPGVLSYQRDRVVDEKAVAAPVASDAATSVPAPSDSDADAPASGEPAVSGS